MASSAIQNTFGLDISERALRLVQLKKSGKKIAMRSYGSIELPEGIIVRGEIKQPDELSQYLSKLAQNVKGKKIRTKNTIAVLPESRTFIQVINASRTDKDEKVSLAIEREIKNHIPLEADKMYLDWQVLKESDTSVKALVGAASKEMVDIYINALENSGLTTYVLEIEAAAILRSLMAQGDDKAKIIIDFGGMRTGLIVFAEKTVQFTVSLPISGSKITSTIAESLNLSEREAEKAKIVCGLNKDKCEGALRKILFSTINDLSAKIKRAITFYNRSASDREPISEVILCGGGANFEKIDEVLSEKIKLPVKIGNPLTNIIVNKKLSLTPKKALSFTTAIGLGLRAFQKNIDL